MLYVLENVPANQFFYRCSDERIMAVTILVVAAVKTAAWLPFDTCFSHDPVVQTLIPLAEMCLTSFNMLLCIGLAIGDTGP